MISIIVPVYNVEKYLPQCIESVLQQTYSDFELLLIDDGSTDKCGQICDNYARKDKRIQVVHQPNRGVSAARNHGIQIARGEYIGFLDSDDWIDPAIYSCMVEWIEKNQVSIVACGWYYYCEEDNKLSLDRKYPPLKMTREDAMYYALKGTHFEGFLGTKLFKKSLLEQAGYKLDEQIHICEDLLFFLNVLQHVDFIYYDSTPLYYYRLHENSALHSFNKKRCTELDAIRHIITLTEGYGKALNCFAKARYSETAVNLYSQASKAKDKKTAGALRQHVWRYAFLYVGSSEFRIKSKIRFILLAFFPVFTSRLWQFVRKVLHVEWIPPSEIEL